MATKRKPTKRRKTSKAKVGSSSGKKCLKKGARVKHGDKNFTVNRRFKKKTDAKKFADGHRKGGAKKLARVVQDGCGYRVDTRG